MSDDSNTAFVQSIDKRLIDLSTNVNAIGKSIESLVAIESNQMTLIERVEKLEEIVRPINLVKQFILWVGSIAFTAFVTVQVTNYVGGKNDNDKLRGQDSPRGVSTVEERKTSVSEGK